MFVDFGNARTEMNSLKFEIGDTVMVGPYSGYVVCITIRANDYVLYGVSFWDGDGKCVVEHFRDFEINETPQERIGFGK